MERSCAATIAVLGASTGVYAENNLIEDVPLTYGGFADCTKFSLGWDADMKIAPQSAANTTTDYNDFYTQSSDTTAPYNWNGTVYPTLTAFQQATAQGAHDLNDPVEPLPVPVGLFTVSVSARLEVGAAAIGSANTHAPGALPTDFGGNSPYIDRGALAFVNDHLTAALTVTDTSALSVRADASASRGDQPIQQYSYDWGDGSSTGGFGAITAAHSYARLGTYTVTVTVMDQLEEYVSTSVSATTAGSDYTAYGPVRILDTRKGIGTGGTVAKVGAGSVLKLQVTGAGTQGDTIPSGITAVVLNLTVTGPASGGYLTAYPNEDPSGAVLSRPASSNVNFRTGQTVPNLAIVPVGRDGIVDLYNGSAGGTDVVADVTGYFTQSPASGYTSLAPDRLVDTRKGTGAAKAQVPGNGSIAVKIAGADGGLLPAGASAVALNVTAVNARAGGYLTVYPDGGNRPTASNLNFVAGRVIANAVIVPVGSDGEIDVFNGSGGGTDVLVDVVGYYSSTGASAYLPIAPVRVLDTRTTGAGPLPPGDYIFLYSQSSVNDPGITSFVLNTTVTNTKGSGYETVAPDPNTLNAYESGTEVWPTPPTVSTLNWSQGQVVPNLVQAGAGQNGIIDVWNRSGGNIDLVVDQFGFYQAD
ncbi:MAG TPA: PKD domain-containing protein [Actinocrinis sp.]|uniref:PKD domain-containing protein n=1 Tax=Actinocrinis sp. TaxID=1920516 RepID=UPI002DDD3320|nr:PKD domain-containing protein [Actinocrinis sp.]HEV2345331.1 PKD domain-containing protein [Actinocrinis sp.]